MLRHIRSTLLVLLGCCGLLSQPASAQQPTLFIESVKLPQNNLTALINRYGLTRDDLKNIRTQIDGIKRIIPQRNTVVEARFGSETMDVFLCGTDENFSYKLNTDQLKGRFLLEKDVRNLNNVAVIGDRVARQLFVNAEPIGQNVRIENDYYLIVGRFDSPVVLQDDPDGPVVDHSHSIFIPLSAMRSRMGDDVIVRQAGSFSAESYELNQLEIEFENPDRSRQVANSIQRLLEANHSERDYKLRLIR